MSDSLLVKKDFLAKLKPDVCCSESGSSYCRVNEFCSSEPRGWPSVYSENETRLSTIRSEAVKGTADFCASYKDWYEKYQPVKILPKWLKPIYFSSPGPKVRWEDRPNLKKGSYPAAVKSEIERRFFDDAQRLADFCNGIKPTDIKKEAPPPKIVSTGDGNETINEILDFLSAKGKWIAIIGGAGLGLIIIWRAIAKLFGRHKKDEKPEIETGKTGRSEAIEYQEAMDRMDYIFRGNPVQLDVPSLFLGPPSVMLRLLRLAFPGIKEQPLYVQLYFENKIAGLQKESGISSEDFISDFKRGHSSDDFGFEQPAALNWIEIHIRDVWRALPEKIRTELGYAGRLDPPPSILQVLMKIPDNLEIFSLRSLARTDTPNSFEEEKEELKGFRLSPVMSALAQMEPELSNYPDLLKSQARALINDWFHLGWEKQGEIEVWAEQFFIKSPMSDSNTPIPWLYIQSWHDHLVSRNQYVTDDSSLVESVPQGEVEEFIEIELSRADLMDVGTLQAENTGGPPPIPGDAKSPPNVREIIAASLNAQPDPKSLLFVPHQWQNMYRQSRVVYDALKKLHPEIKKQPPIIQLYLEDWANNHVRMHAHGRPMDVVLKEFIKQLHVDLKTYGEKAREWIRQPIVIKWNKLPPSIKQEFNFGGVDNLVSAIVKALNVVADDENINPDELFEPYPDGKKWQYDARREVFHNTVSVDAVMDSLLYQNRELASYPQLLEVEARLLIDSWMSIDASKRNDIQLQARNEKDPFLTMGRTIPLLYVWAWHRRLIQGNDGGSAPAGGASPPTGGKIEVVPSGETSAMMPDMMSGAAILLYDNDLNMMGAYSFGLGGLSTTVPPAIICPPVAPLTALAR